MALEDRFTQWAKAHDWFRLKSTPNESLWITPAGMIVRLAVGGDGHHYFRSLTQVTANGS